MHPVFFPKNSSTRFFKLPLKEIYIEACDAFDIPAGTHFGKKKSTLRNKIKSVNKLKSIIKDILYLRK